LAEIAGEKAGIIKAGVPVVVAPQKTEALQVVRRIAAERNAPMIQVGVDYRFMPVERSRQGQSLYLWTAAEAAEMDAYLQPGYAGAWKPAKLSIPLIGAHQAENAAVAYAALQTAGARGLPLVDSAILDGFARVDWPGRFEILQTEPPLVIDAAHNRDSAQKLCATLDDYYPGREVILVFGASHDKDIAGMLDELMPRARQLILTRSYHPRAIAPEGLAEWASKYEVPVQIVPAVEDALEQALHLVDGHSMVLVTGSLFVAAGARDTWYNHLVASSG
jgi:dihydrofolate synthase/folylpolyglutamate synthase